MTIHFLNIYKKLWACIESYYRKFSVRMEDYIIMHRRQIFTFFKDWFDDKIITDNQSNYRDPLCLHQSTT